MNKVEVNIGSIYRHNGDLVVVHSLDREEDIYAYYNCLYFGKAKTSAFSRADSDYMKEFNWEEYLGKTYKITWKEPLCILRVYIQDRYIDIDVTTTGQKEFYEKLKSFKSKCDNAPNIVVKDVNFDNIKADEINTEGDNISEKFTSIVGNMSELTAGINKEFSIDSHKELTESFLEARRTILDMTSTTTGTKGFFSRLLNKTEIGKKLTMESKEFYAKSQNTQKTIDTIFDAIYAKYDNFIQVAENLQKARGTMVQQVDALKELLKQSNAELKKFKKVNRPIRKIALNTEIKSSIEKFKQRIVKIDGAIVATQTTIMALAKDLPSMKTDLTDEMAIGSLLTSVDDYQQMYQEAAKLVTEATEVTAVKTYDVVSNLLDAQIKDTHAIEYLKQAAGNADRFKKMFAEKTGLLANKIMKDSDMVAALPQTIVDNKPNLLVAR